MSTNSSGKNDFISVPKGGGALNGLGEKFSPDLHTGTGNFSIPIALPSGRNGFQPELSLQYSTGNANGIAGLGWNMSIPNITRKTSKGIPVYDDCKDNFVLSGFEDLVNTGNENNCLKFQPRTEEAFAKILYHNTKENSFWEVKNKNGLISYYGSPGKKGIDPALIYDPYNDTKEFSWKLTETKDVYGNRIRYTYINLSDSNCSNKTEEIYLNRIEYVDYGEGEKFLISVNFEYEERPDCFSNFKSGFEIRISKRLRSITIYSHPGNIDIPVKKYAFNYSNDSLNKLSLLTSVQLIGFNDADEEVPELAPLQLKYSAFMPNQNSKLTPLTGDVPFLSQKNKHFEFTDLDGNGLPDIVEFNGQITAWKNKGNGRFLFGGIMPHAPSVDLSQPAFNLIDANGDGRADIMLSGSSAGFFSLQFDGKWDQRSFQAYRLTPDLNLRNPDIRLLDITGDGITDIVQTSSNINYFYNHPLPAEAWKKHTSRNRTTADDFPNISFSDPRVKTADMNGDGMQDIVFIESGRISYWPNRGYGNWGNKVIMKNSPLNLPDHFEMNSVLVGDVDGDGLADIVLIESNQIRLWINQSGENWSDEIVISGTPPFYNGDDVRIIDLLGTGVSGILWSSTKSYDTNDNYYFLDLTGSIKPYLLREVNNNIGSIIKVEYTSSANEYLRDKNAGVQWQSHLPFPVLIVKKVEVIDQLSKSKLITTYNYHHGHWDGEEREFRGFGMVEQSDTEMFDQYHEANLFSDEADILTIHQKHFSQPVLIKNWFHSGPVRKSSGYWKTIDFSNEYFSIDKNIINTPKIFSPANDHLFDERHSRDMLRALRGKLLRQESFVLDRSSVEKIPFSVKENAYGVRIEYSGENIFSIPVIFPFLTEERETRWERGEDPLTSFTITDDYDAFGQARKITRAAMPRRESKRKKTVGKNYNEDLNEKRILTSYQQVRFAQPVTGKYIQDRVAEIHSYELNDDIVVYKENDPEDIRHILRQQYHFALSIHKKFLLNNPAETHLLTHALNYYDGNAYTGLPLGAVGNYGALVKTENLAFTDSILEKAYSVNDDDKRRPLYLDGNAAFIANTPAGFGMNTGFYNKAAAPPFKEGYYMKSVSNKYDFQESDTFHGLLDSTKDSLDNITSIEYDSFNFLPYMVTDALGNAVIADYDYRFFAPGCITDSNWNKTWIQYSPLGLPERLYKQNMNNTEGGSSDHPDLLFEYNFHYIPDAITPIPIFVDTVARVRRNSEETIRSREYSDGFGRMIQKVTQADDIRFSDNGLAISQNHSSQTAIGITTDTADWRKQNTVVSGWQVYNNKGWVVEKYEPFYTTGYDFKPEYKTGVHVEIFYDSIGREQQIFNPDGSQQLIIHGSIEDLNNPYRFNPSPWEKHIYDGNDLAVESGINTGDTEKHHYTPQTLLNDALGRTVVELKRNSNDDTDEWFITYTIYDIKGNPLIIYDAKKRAAFRYQYDLLDRTLSINSIDAGIRTRVYNAAGNIIEYADSKGSLVLKEYDELNRLKLTWVRNNYSEQSLRLAERIVYGEEASDDRIADNNLIGKVYKHYDESGVTIFTDYDFMGNLLQKSRIVINHDLIGMPIDWTGNTNVTADEAENPLLDSFVYQTNYSYDALNRIIRITYPADVNHHRAELKAGYSPSGKLRTVILDEEEYVHHISYNARDQRILIAYGNHFMTRYAYDAVNFRLQRMRTESYKQDQPSMNFLNAGTVLQDFSYRYDPVGNITSLRHSVADSGIVNSVEGKDVLTRLFTYDAVYRLLSATGREAEEPVSLSEFGENSFVTDHSMAKDYRQSYEYDEAGNFLYMRHRHNGATVSRVKKFNNEENNNRLRKISISGNDFLYSYDENGNLLKETESRLMQWDHSDRLITFTVTDGNGNHSVNAKYHYDMTGARVIKKNNRIITIYIDGIFEHSVNKVTGESNNHLHVMDDKSRIVIKRVGDAMDDTRPPVQYHLGDHLGSSNVTVGGWDATGNQKISNEEYYPYGETSFGGYAKKRYRYSGKEKDEESGMYYYGARYYLPWAGRWGSCDPMGFIGQFSMFDFCLLNPIGYKDNRGCAPISTKNDVEAQNTVGSLLEQKASQAMFEGNETEATILNVVRTGWEIFGSERLSIVADKGKDSTKGEVAMAGIETIINLFGGKIIAAVGKPLLSAAKPIVLTTMLKASTPELEMVASKELAPFISTLFNESAEATAKQAASQTTSKLIKPLEGRVNVGGGFETPTGWTNLQPYIDSTGGPVKGVPNALVGKAEDMAEIFIPGSVREMMSSKLMAGSVDLNKWAQSAYVSMAEGGKFEINFLANEAYHLQVAEAFREAGFKNVQVELGVLVTGTR